MPRKPWSVAVYFEAKNVSHPDRWMVDFKWTDSTGKTKRIRRQAVDAKGRLATSKTAAEKCEDTIRSKLALGTFEAEKQPKAEETVGTPTLAKFKAQYFRDHVATLKPSSQSAQETIWRVSLLPVLGDVPLNLIDSEALAKLTRTLRDREASPKTVNNALSSLRTALTHAEDWKLIGAVPRVKWLKVPQQKFDFFTFEETAKLVAVAPPMVIVALKTGMRLGELLALRWSDVHLERKQLTVARSVWWGAGGEPHEGPPKNHKSRHLSLSVDALAALRGLKETRRDEENDGRVFVNAGGSQMTKGECKWPLWNAEEAAGLRLTGWHVLRHTFASHLVMKGASIAAVQQLLGHSTIAMTMRYSHLAPDHLAAAVSLLDG